MSDQLPFTGERFVPGIGGEIVYEHVHRYAFARELVPGKRVLDAACGEGYGSALLAGRAAQVTGVDIDSATIAHACQRYAATPGLSFVEASAAELPLDDASIDVVVSFETIEHLAPDLQVRMLSEFARVLASGGILLLSAPNRVEYSDKRGYANPFHLHEHDRSELDRLLTTHFAARRFFRQRIWLGSTIWREDGARATLRAYAGDGEEVKEAGLPEAMYFIVIAAAEEAALPRDTAGVSLFSDPEETELVRAYDASREAMRLDRVLGERTAMLDQKTAHVEHLEKLVAYRDGLIVERDNQLAQQTLQRLQFERQRIELDELRAQLAAQERIIDAHQGWHWWSRLPLAKLRRWWHHTRGA